MTDYAHLEKTDKIPGKIEKLASILQILSEVPSENHMVCFTTYKDKQNPYLIEMPHENILYQTFYQYLNKDQNESNVGKKKSNTVTQSDGMPEHQFSDQSQKKSSHTFKKNPYKYAKVDLQDITNINKDSKNNASGFMLRSPPIYFYPEHVARSFQKKGFVDVDVPESIEPNVVSPVHRDATFTENLSTTLSSSQGQNDDRTDYGQNDQQTNKHDNRQRFQQILQDDNDEQFLDTSSDPVIRPQGQNDQQTNKNDNRQNDQVI